MKGYVNIYLREPG